MLLYFIAAFAGTYRYATSAKEAQHPGKGPQPLASVAEPRKEDAPSAACQKEGGASPADTDVGAELRMDLIPDRCAIACFYPLLWHTRRALPEDF